MKVSTFILAILMTKLQVVASTTCYADSKYPKLIAQSGATGTETTELRSIIASNDAIFVGGSATSELLTTYTHTTGLIARYEQSSNTMSWIYTYYAYDSVTGFYIDSVAALALNPDQDKLVAYLTGYGYTLGGDAVRCFVRVDPSTGVVKGNIVCPSFGNGDPFVLGRSIQMDDYGYLYAGFSAGNLRGADQSTSPTTYGTSYYSGFPIAMRLDFSVEGSEAVSLSSELRGWYGKLSSLII